jgi:hypothetical protein
MMATLRRLMPVGLVAGLVLCAAAAVFAAAGGSSSRGSASVAEYCKIGDAQPGAAGRYLRDDVGCGQTAGGQGENGGGGNGQGGGGNQGDGGNQGVKNESGGGNGSQGNNGVLGDVNGNPASGVPNAEVSVGGRTLPFTGFQALMALALAAALISAGLVVRRFARRQDL